MWDVALVVLNPTSLYHGAYLKASGAVPVMPTARVLTLSQAELKMPKNYPMSPPEFRFTRPLFHPNIYKDGKLCISILHSPGDDEMSGELASVYTHRHDRPGARGPPCARSHIAMG